MSKPRGHWMILYSALSLFYSTIVMVCGCSASFKQVPMTQTPIEATVATQNPISENYLGLSVGDYVDLTPTMKFHTVRSWDSHGMLWLNMNPASGVFDFSALDQFLAFAKSHDADVIYTFGGTPKWASSNPASGGAYGLGACAPPKDLKSWDAFVAAIARHAAGRIKYWEIWNEPQDSNSFCGDTNTLVTMAVHASSILREVDPSARILSPAGVGENGPAWLASFLSSGGGEVIDIIAIHGYSSTNAQDILSVVNKFRLAASESGVYGKELWDTESNWGGNGVPGPMTETAQAAYLAQSFLLHQSAGVDRFVWYQYDGGPTWGGLWNASEGESPAALAYKQIYDWLVGATLSSPCSADSSGIWSCHYTRTGGYRSIAVWSGNGAATYSVPANYTEYRDLTGASHLLSSRSISITSEPILIESSPLQ